MSRSRKKTPIFGVAANNNCKQWRSFQNRKYRAYNKNLIRHEQYDIIQGYCGRFGNEWDSPRDGKYYLGAWQYLECGKYTWFSSNGKLYRNCDDDHWRCAIALKKLMRK